MDTLHYPQMDLSELETLHIRSPQEATKDYDNSLISNIDEDVDLTQTSIKVTNPSGITENTYVYVGSEEMFVEKVLGDSMVVRRKHKIILLHLNTPLEEMYSRSLRKTTS